MYEFKKLTECILSGNIDEALKMTQRVFEKINDNYLETMELHKYFLAERIRANAEEYDESIIRAERTINKNLTILVKLIDLEAMLLNIKQSKNIDYV